jgi:hypothetical protein
MKFCSLRYPNNTLNIPKVLVVFDRVVNPDTFNGDNNVLLPLNIELPESLIHEYLKLVIFLKYLYNLIYMWY